MKVFRSVVIDVDVDLLWAIVRDFSGTPRWNSFVTSCEIENGMASTQVGCIRKMTIANGAVYREILLAHSDIERYFTYNILESPLTVKNYVATQRFQPVTDGNRTYASWRVEFDAGPERQAELDKTIGDGIFMNGLNAIKSFFESQ